MHGHQGLTNSVAVSISRSNSLTLGIKSRQQTTKVFYPHRPNYCVSKVVLHQGHPRLAFVFLEDDIHTDVQQQLPRDMASTLATRGAGLLAAWKRLQVSYYGGKYSIHRLLALEAFSQSTSLWRALATCVGTPLPMAVLVFVQESIPLQDPRDGWRANYGFWLRVVILTFVITHFSTGQAVYFIDGFSISTRQLVLLSASVSGTFTLCTLPIGANVIFPLPFSILAMTPIYNVLHIVLFRLVMGGQAVRQLMLQRAQLVKYMNFLYAQIVMMFLYPVYELLFRSAEGSRYQLLVILLLPVIKVLIKNVVLRCTAHVEDITPEAVIFTVDFFNAVYVATCMQSASSAFAICAITITDLSQTAIMLYGLHRRTSTILPLLRQTVETAGHQESLLRALGALCRDPDKVGKQVLTDVRARSCFPHPLSPADATLVDTLALIDQRSGSSTVLPFRRSSSLASLDELPKPRKCWPICPRRHLSSIHPDPIALVNLTALVEEPRAAEKRHPSVLRRTDHPNLLRDSLEVLFTIECLVVTAYLEAVIPFFYTTYILVMVHVPSARYHTEMNGVTRENVSATVFPVFIFGVLQVVSFALLLAVVKRNCGMQALSHLAFVLHAQSALIRGKLMIWMVITLCFRVVHFGKRSFKRNLGS
jgi:hypothetical protein